MTGRCPICKKGRIILDNGEYKCDYCGRVIDDKVIDLGPEWRSYTPEQYQSRARAHPIDPVRVPGGIPPTFVGGSMDARGNRLGLSKSYISKRIRSLQRRSMSSSLDRSLSTALREIQSASSKLSLPKVVCDESVMLVRRALEKGLARGRSVKLLSAVAVYHTAKLYRVPKTPDEVARVFGLDKEQLLSFYRVFQDKGIIRGSITPSDSMDFAKQIVTKKRLGVEVIRLAKKLIEAAELTGITMGKPPRTVAAAVVYAVVRLLGLNCPRKDIAETVQISEATIRARVKELQKHVNITFYV